MAARLDLYGRSLACPRLQPGRLAARRFCSRRGGIRRIVRDRALCRASSHRDFRLPQGASRGRSRTRMRVRPRPGARAVPLDLSQGAPLQVALLQGNIPQDLKFQADRYTATLTTYKRLVEASQGELIVLPETAIPRFLDAVDPGYLKDIARIAAERRADVLIGVPIRDPDGRYFNSVVSVGVSPSQRYDKSHLVPFGEFVPSGFHWIVKMVAIPMSDFSLGRQDPRPLSLAGQRVAPNICWEDAFGEEIIRQLPEATLLVNVSNVAWFSDSLAPAQHLQISRMRALETGRAMLRATNTGMTAIIDPRGAVAARLPQFAESILEGTVQGYVGASPYVKFGNTPIVLLSVVLLGALVFIRRRVGRVGESR